MDRDRWVGYVPIPLRPSPNIGRVGIHYFPFEACSGFTRVTACQVAAALMAYICPQSFSRKVSLSHCLGSYRDEPTISRAELSSTGTLRPRGAPRSCGHWIEVNACDFAYCFNKVVKKEFFDFIGWKLPCGSPHTHRNRQFSPKRVTLLMPELKPAFKKGMGCCVKCRIIIGCAPELRGKYLQLKSKWGQR